MLCDWFANESVREKKTREFRPWTTLVEGCPPTAMRKAVALPFPVELSGAPISQPGCPVTQSGHESVDCEGQSENR